jgi:hypothetical protein
MAKQMPYGNPEQQKVGVAQNAFNAAMGGGQRSQGGDRATTMPQPIGGKIADPSMYGATGPMASGPRPTPPSSYPTAFTGRSDRLGAMGTPGLTPEQEVSGRSLVAGLGTPIDPAEHDRRHQALYGGGASQAQRPAGDFSRMQGYDANNWDSMNSFKYNVGRILSRYGASPSGAQQALNDPDLRAIAPNARFASDNGRNDVIDFGGAIDPHTGLPIGLVDVGLSFDPNNPNAETAWVWQDLVNDGGGGGGVAAQGGGVNLAPSDLLTALQGAGGGNDTMKKIQAEIQALINGGGSPLAMDAFNGAMR